MRTSSGHAQPSQEIDRKLLRTALTNATNHARMAQRVVAVLMLTLSRSDRLDAILGVPTRQIMQQAMRRVAGALRPDDRVVQLTDEKLCVILPNLRNEALPLLAASKIQQAFETPFSFEEHNVIVRPYIGIATFPAQAGNSEELLVHADIAKDIARSRDVLHYVFQADDRRVADTHTDLSNELRDAIRTNQLEVHYQPKFDLKSGQCRSVEALLRWTLPEHGAIPPPSIIRVAEGNGMIGVLTEWVLNTALRHQSEWKHLGTNVDVAVNLSTVTLGDGQLPDMIGQVLASGKRTRHT